MAAKIYGLNGLSDYGRSYIQPLLIFLLMTTCFSFAYWHWEMRLGGPSDPEGAIAFTMEQIVRPFFIWTSNESTQSELVAVITHSPLAIRLVTMAESLASIGLVALFILALRRQFRLH